MPVTEVVDRRHGAWTGSQGLDRSYRFSRKFFVATDNVNDGPQVVLSDSRIPKVGDIYHVGYDRMDAAICISREAKLSGESPTIWEVDCEFSSATDAVDIGSSEVSDDPLSAPLQISYDSTQSTRPLERAKFIPEGGSYDDAEVKPILNSAGQQFDPPPEIDDSRPIFILTKNMASFDPNIPRRYRNAINSDDFFGCPPRTVKLVKLTATREVNVNLLGTLEYYRVTGEFELSEEDEEWCLRLLDQGLMEKDPEVDPISPDHNWRNIKDDNDEPVSQPVCLNGHGFKQTEKDSDGLAVGVYRTWYPYRLMPFGALGFGV